uniref:RING-type E3 ubiquitin transferase n=1 Tax=Ananas comosus var. bracteatus TaxID=296719 RepID=A0A6V7NEQ1_ANACO|nr:unnamed protein product [Ananas comosus var. bracteatus]
MRRTAGGPKFDSSGDGDASHRPPTPTLHLRPPPPSPTIAPASVRSLPMLLPVFIFFLFVLLSFLSVFLCRDLLHFASLGCTAVAASSASPAPLPQVIRERRRAGLDSRILASFPMIPYSAVKGMQEGKCGIECAVCWRNSGSDARAAADGVLPRIPPACIDSWLDTHSTCPLCRSDLKAPPDEAAVMAFARS